MYALVLRGADVDDDSLLLQDWTWISFPRLLIWPTPRAVDLWLFDSAAAAEAVREEFLDFPIEVVPI